MQEMRHGDTDTGDADMNNNVCFSFYQTIRHTKYYIIFFIYNIII